MNYKYLSNCLVKVTGSSFRFVFIPLPNGTKIWHQNLLPDRMTGSQNCCEFMSIWHMRHLDIGCMKSCSTYIQWQIYTYSELTICVFALLYVYVHSDSDEDIMFVCSVLQSFVPGYFLIKQHEQTPSKHFHNSSDQRNQFKVVISHLTYIKVWRNQGFAL